MSTEKVRQFFQERNLNYQIWEFETSTATVELAAAALGVEPARIAKTMAIRLKEQVIVVVAKGDARLDNRKFKDCFKQKARMLSPEEVLEATGYPVGGVCPFALENVRVYLDVSLQEFDYVYPAAGTPNSATKISPQELAEVTGGAWVDVCKS